MPCQSDYLAQSGQELESIRVCKFIGYLQKRIGIETPKWIKKAANNYYGNTGRLDEATKILCSHLRSLTKREMEKYVYDAHKKTARKLASWWEKHQEWDKRRVKEEDGTRKKIIAKERALKKLTVGDMEALGLTEE